MFQRLSHGAKTLVALASPIVLHSRNHVKSSVFNYIVAKTAKSLVFSDIVASKIALSCFQQHRGFVRMVLGKIAALRVHFANCWNPELSSMVGPGIDLNPRSLTRQLASPSANPKPGPGPVTAPFGGRLGTTSPAPSDLVKGKPLSYHIRSPS